MAAIELGWEALTTAERIAPGFAAIVDTEKRESVDVRFLSCTRTGVVAVAVDDPTAEVVQPSPGLHFCTVESLRIKAAKVCEKEGLSTDLDQKVFLDSLPTNGALCPQQSISRNLLIAAGE